MKNKRRNSTNDLGFVKVKPIGHVFNGPYGLNLDITFGPNGRVDYKPVFILPKGYKGACHLHDKPVLFKTFVEMEIHRINHWKTRS